MEEGRKKKIKREIIKREGKDERKRIKIQRWNLFLIVDFFLQKNS